MRFKMSLVIQSIASFNIIGLLLSIYTLPHYMPAYGQLIHFKRFSFRSESSCIKWHIKSVYNILQKLIR